MIDTVVMRLHDLGYHKKVVQQLDIKKTQERSIFLKWADLSELAIKEGKTRYEMMMFGEGKMWAKSIRGSIYIKSSSYFLAFSINIQRNFVEFNFSVPKYLYGNNIAQYVVNDMSLNFKKTKHILWDGQLEVVYTRLKKAIKYFFSREFPHCDIDYRLLELCRVDFCYNQIFNSKEEALYYLEMQRKLNKKYMRNTSDNYGNYSTGLSYKTETGYFKIYHKGTEYKRNDSKEHEILNEKLLKRDGVIGFFDIERLQNISDKILRYEFEFNFKGMSVAFADMMAKKSSQYERFKKYHQKSKMGEELNRLTKIEKEFYTRFKKAYQKRRRFYIEGDVISDFDFIGRNSQIRQTEQKFTKSLCLKGVERFKDFFYEFQVKEAMKMDEIKKQIMLKNNEIRGRKMMFREEKKFLTKDRYLELTGGREIKQGRLMGFLTLIENHGSIDEVKRLGIYNERTLRRYIAEIKAMGFYRNMITEYKGVKCSNDFAEYYQLLIENRGALHCTDKQVVI